MGKSSAISACLLSLFLTACGGPDSWASKFEGSASCDSSVAQVQALTGKAVTAIANEDQWVTHRMGEPDGTWVELGFAEGKLKALQVFWVSGFKRIAQLQPVALCGVAPPGTPNWAFRLPPN